VRAGEPPPKGVTAAAHSGAPLPRRRSHCAARRSRTGLRSRGGTRARARTCRRRSYGPRRPPRHARSPSWSRTLTRRAAPSALARLGDRARRTRARRGRASAAGGSKRLPPARLARAVPSARPRPAPLRVPPGGARRHARGPRSRLRRRGRRRGRERPCPRRRRARRDVRAMTPAGPRSGPRLHARLAVSLHEQHSGALGHRRDDLAGQSQYRAASFVGLTSGRRRARSAPCAPRAG
jgi:hypothetical protein